MFLTNKMLKHSRRFLDIGANRGIYTYHFLKQFKAIDVFEPLEPMCAAIKRLKSKKVTVHNVALSDRTGEEELFTPLIRNKLDFQQSSFSKEVYNQERGLRQIIKTRNLDEFKFKDIDFMKIDTEGSELLVMKGAYETISVNRPLILIEMEERHRKNSILEGFSFINGLGYRGCFYNLRDKSFYDLENNISLPFSQLKINNFIFYDGLRHKIDVRDHFK